MKFCPLHLPPGGDDFTVGRHYPVRHTGFPYAASRPLPQVDFPVIMVSASLPVRHQKQWRLPLPRRWSAHLGALPESAK